ncbi:hypothetical protein NG895_18875 [Aeoliella sp. ICT_H6.2]|uniref:Carboxypeptidase regulatory-like domain-containing protein n=1 Tax=Aeoliella straminimaris TaxID=2954799 RepID=A0A9X2FD21_9BACT|nr:hypothetical protein [Aeoliella straminimaris]MCO6045968.1 hypothetical protein [Aeoliella straminimaris]
MRLTFKTLLTCLVVAFIAGCESKPEGRMTVYPTTGSVTVDGSSAEGVKIVLYGATPDLQGPGTVAPYAITDAEGKFSLTSYESNDGAPAGSFKVCAIWPEPTPPDADEEFFEPEDRLKGKYETPDSTPLQTTVEEGGSELPPFELSTK